MKIYLIPPGENNSGKLTEMGRTHLFALARRLGNEKVDVDRIYVNSNSVSRESGEILSKYLKIPLTSDERFSEIKKETILGDIDDLDGENLNYINLFVEEIVNKGKDAIITIGGGVHRVVLSKLTGMNLEQTKYFSFHSSGISIVEFDTGKWRISRLNDRNHIRIP